MTAAIGRLFYKKFFPLTGSIPCSKKCPRGPWSYTMCLSLAESPRLQSLKMFVSPKKAEERETDMGTVGQA